MFTKLLPIFSFFFILTVPGCAAAEVPTSMRNEFSTDFSRHSISYDEVISGGPQKDGIPAIDRPSFVSVEEAGSWIGGTEPVIVLRREERGKIYPLQILMYHEIVNDTIMGIPVAVTYCPLCNTSAAFRRTVNGKILDFGTTGRLRYSNLLMYDRQTESWWQQATGTAVIGTYTGKELELFPSLLISWEEAETHFPEARVLSKQTGFERPYGRNPYRGYDSGSPWAYQGPEIPDSSDPLDRVLAVSKGEETNYYSYREMREQRVVNGEISGTPIAVFWFPGTSSSLDTPIISEGKDVGTVNAYWAELGYGEHETLEFSLSNDDIVDLQTGSVWTAAGIAVEGPLAGKALTPLPGVQHFWFSAYAFSDGDFTGENFSGGEEPEQY